MILIDTLAIEHGLIKQMINLMRKELESMAETGTLRVSSVGVLIDFMSTYAHRCHSGKEDTILLNRLLSKNVSAEHHKILQNFKKEHAFASRHIKKLQKARDEYLHGSQSAFSLVKECLQILVDFYPKHMAREEELLSILSIEYFTDEEREDMLEEFWDFDKKLIKEKYRLKNPAKKAARAKPAAYASSSRQKPLSAFC